MGPVKRILAALLLMATALGMCGCMTGDLGAERYSAKMRQMVLDYMRDKYDEEFELTQDSLEGQYYPGTEVAYTVYPLSHPEWREEHPNWRVRVTHDGQQGHDNYVAFLVNADLPEVLRPYIEQVYEGEYRLFAQPPNSNPMPDGLGKGTTPEEFAYNTTTSFSLILVEDSERRNEDAQKIWELIKSQPDTWSTIISVYYVPAAYMQSDTSFEYKKPKELEWEWYGILYITGSEYKDVEWREGPV